MFNKSDKESHRSSDRREEVPASIPPRPVAGEAKVARAVIGASLRFKGELSGNEDLVVQGRFEGTIELHNNNLTVGKQGSVTANVQAKIITVEGEVQGDLTGEERIVIRESGNVHCNLIAPRVSLDDGAKFKGSIDMEPKSVKAVEPTRQPNRHEPKKDTATTQVGGAQTKTASGMSA
jgi:cytoskeletal protein CcmA (bactofilin family)